MFDKLFKKIDQNKGAQDQKQSAEAAAGSVGTEEKEDMLDETGTFMLDINKLKECEDLEDLLNDV